MGHESMAGLSAKKDETKGKGRLWLIFLILLPLLINTIRTPNNDFGTITTIVRDWLAGRVSLYEAGSAYFFYTPWVLFLYIPLSFLPHPAGQLIFNTLSYSLLVWSAWYLVKPIDWWKLAISLTTIYTVMLIFQGQWDAYVLAALTLGWIGIQRENPWLVGIALLGMTTKVTNVIIPLLLLLYALRHWSFKNLLRVALIPSIVVLISFFIAGLDWPLRYTRLLKVSAMYYTSIEVNTIFSTATYPTSYRLVFPPLGLIVTIILAVISVYLLVRVWKRGINLTTLNLSLALNLIITPYLTFHHIIYLVPLQAQLLKQNRIFGFVLYATAFIDLLFLWLGIGLIVYPIIALLISQIVTFKSLHHPDEYPLLEGKPLAD